MAVKSVNHYEIAIESVKWLEGEMVRLGADSRSTASQKLNRITRIWGIPMSLQNDIRDVLKMRNAISHERNCQTISDPYRFVSRFTSAKWGLSLIGKNTSQTFEEALAIGYTFASHDHDELTQMKKASDSERERLTHQLQQCQNKLHHLQGIRSEQKQQIDRYLQVMKVLEFELEQLRMNSKFKINIRMNSRRSTDIFVRSDDTIYKVKEKLHVKKSGLVPPPKQQILANIAGIQLDDDKTLRFYHINKQWGATLILKTIKRNTVRRGNNNRNVSNQSVHNMCNVEEKAPPDLDPTMPIVIKTLTDKVMNIDVTSKDTVQSVKEQVQNQAAIPPEQQRLIFGGKVLKNDRILSDYDVQPNSTLWCIRMGIRK
eukprot:4919_1